MELLDPCTCLQISQGKDIFILVVFIGLANFYLHFSEVPRNLVRRRLLQFRGYASECERLRSHETFQDHSSNLPSKVFGVGNGEETD